MTFDVHLRPIDGGPRRWIANVVADSIEQAWAKAREEHKAGYIAVTATVENSND